MRRALALFGILCLGLVAAAAAVTAPDRAPPPSVDGIVPDLARGETVFLAAGCASCHADPATDDAALPVLAGGRAFESEWGTFRAPNISPDPDAGIGAWSAGDLVRAMRDGVSPEGRHYYPACPYTAYTKASTKDLVSLHAYLMTLPPDDAQSAPHDLRFPYSVRRLAGGWKWFFLDRDWTVSADLPRDAARGRYLVEALGHCGECHTPRSVFGAVDEAQWLAGAPDPAGTGTVPNITPARLDWSAEEIARYMGSGERPDGRRVTGYMFDVVENYARLSPADRAAVAAYLKAVPAR